MIPRESLLGVSPTFRINAYRPKSAGGGTGIDHESHPRSERDVLAAVREQIRAGAILVTIKVKREA